MAFATSNVKVVSMGSVNGLVGDWTGLVGDTSASIVVGGARVYLANFYDQTVSTPTNSPFPVSVSTSGELSTVSVNYAEDVTNGRFCILFS